MERRLVGLNWLLGWISFLFLHYFCSELMVVVSTLVTMGRLDGHKTTLHMDGRLA